jgi:hypothetical protein
MAAAPQRARWLREMGYRPMALRRTTAHGDAHAEIDAARAAPASTPTVTQPVPSDARGAEAHADPTAAAGTALWTALLHACDAEPADAEVLGWKQSCIDQAFAFVGAELHFNLSLLRRQPAAKRALWRTLRALRRQRREVR